MDNIQFETEQHHDLQRVWGRAEGYKIIPPALYPVQHNFINLRGKQTGRLTVKAYLGKIRANRPGRWLCLCDCGKYCIRAGYIFKHENEDGQMCQDCNTVRRLEWLAANG